MHRELEKVWTVESLAKEVGMSRSGFSARRLETQRTLFRIPYFLADDFKLIFLEPDKNTVIINFSGFWSWLKQIRPEHPLFRNGLQVFTILDACTVLNGETCTLAGNWGMIRNRRTFRMNRKETLKLLQAQKAELKKQFGVIKLALFGSTARDTTGPNSDIDILVEFDGPATSARYFGVQFYLEDLLGQPVDLVTEKALRPELRPFIEREALYV